ncbi:alpha-(1-_6)-mannopyranosyltransferase A [Gordonia soli]|nr:alpha-(1->6)-mannopyranosyltransferase A [Gordonia soli]
MGGSARLDLIVGAVGSVLVAIGAFGVADIPRAHPVAADAGFAWMSYGHGKTLSATVFWLGVAAMVIAWIRLGRRLAVRPERSDGPATEHPTTPAPSLRALRWWALMWSVPMLVTVPIYSRDVYAYLAQAAVFRAGFDPYADGPAHYPGPLLDSMAQVWATTTAPYGPFFMALTRGVVEVTGDHVILGVIAVRLVMVPGLLLALWAIPRIARTFGASARMGLWLVLFNPMVVIHLVGGPHVELLLLGVVVTGLALVLGRRHVLGTAVLGLAVSIKVTAGIAIPFVVWIWLSHLRDQRTAADGDPDAAAAAHAGPADGQAAVGVAGGEKPTGISTRTVVGVFAAVTLIPVAVFAVCTVALGLGLGWLTGLGWADRIINWFTVPTVVAHAVTLIAAPFTALNIQPVLSVTRLVAQVVLAVLLVWLWWRYRRDARSAMVGMAWAMAAVLVLEPSTLPWYYTWLLGVLVAFTLPPRVRALIVGVSTFMLIVFQPDDSIVFYKVPETLLALALSVLAAWSVLRVDPLRLRRSVAWLWGSRADAAGLGNERDGSAATEGVVKR